MIILHDLGYKLADSQKDLTPMQSLFLTYGVNYRTKQQQEQLNSQNSNGSNKPNKSNKNELMQIAKQRQSERGEVSNG